VKTRLGLKIWTVLETNACDKEYLPARSAVEVSVYVSLCRCQPLVLLFCSTSCLFRYTRNTELLEIKPEDATAPQKPKNTALRLKTTSLKSMTHWTNSWGEGNQQKEKAWKLWKST